MDEENPHSVSWDDIPSREEEKMEESEDEDDHAPLPPEMIAASFEAAKPQLIEDNDDASAPPEQIASRHGDEEDEPDEAEDEDCAPLPPEMIAASFEAAKPKLIDDYDDASAPPEQIASPYKGYSDEDDEPDEAEDEDCAPLPPEMIAASFEAAKPKLIEDYDDVSIPPEQIASPFEGYGDEDEKVEETDYDCAPPEMIAASYEAAKPKMTEESYYVFASPFEGHGDEEEKVEEAEDEDCAPLPPDMIAASFEAAKPKWIEDKDDRSVSRKGIDATFEVDGNNAERRVEVDDKVAPVLLEKATMSTKAVNLKSINNGDCSFLPGPEVMYASFQGKNYEEEKRGEVENNCAAYDTDFIPGVSDKNITTATTENRKNILDNSSLSHLQPSTATNDYVDAVSSSRPSQRGNDLSLYDSDQRHSDDFGLYLSPNVMSGSHPSIDPSHQSLPLLKARLVHDLPEEPVYDAFPIDSTLDKDSRGLSMQARKYRFVISGLVLSAAAATIAVSVVVSSDKKNDRTGSNSFTETVFTSTTSTIIPLNASAPPPCSPCLWKKQEEVIIGTAAGDSLGWAVALSADEMTLVVGAPGTNNDDKKRGYVEVHYRDNITELVQTIYGDKIGDLFGYSVDIAANSTILAIGSPGNWKESDRPGYVRVYHRESSDDLGLSWKPLGQDITGEKLGAEFGRYVSLSDDGRTLAVVVERNNGTGQNGLVRIYQRGDDSTSWEQLGQVIEGEELSLSGDGKTVAIGAPWNNEFGQNRGCVKVYKFVSETSLWEPMGDTLHGEVNGDYLGWFVDLSADGTILATGSAGYQAYDRVGFVRVYRLEIGDDGFSWKKHGQDITGEALGDEFGSSGFLSSDGNTVAVAAFDSNGHGGGHVEVHRMNNTSLKWTQQGEDISDDIADDYSRYTALSLSGNGKTVVIGTFGNNGNGSDSGLVRIFTKE